MRRGSCNSELSYVHLTGIIEDVGMSLWHLFQMHIKTRRTLCGDFQTNIALVNGTDDELNSSMDFSVMINFEKKVSRIFFLMSWKNRGIPPGKKSQPPPQDQPLCKFCCHTEALDKRETTHTLTLSEFASLLRRLKVNSSNVCVLNNNWGCFNSVLTDCWVFTVLCSAALAYPNIDDVKP